jgi:hypothetical protein
VVNGIIEYKIGLTMVYDTLFIAITALASLLVGRLGATQMIQARIIIKPQGIFLLVRRSPDFGTEYHLFIAPPLSLPSAQRPTVHHPRRPVRVMLIMHIFS